MKKPGPAFQKATEKPAFRVGLAGGLDELEENEGGRLVDGSVRPNPLVRETGQG